MCRPLYLLHIYLTLVESAGTAHTDGSNTCSNQQYGTTVSSQTVLPAPRLQLNNPMAFSSIL